MASANERLQEIYTAQEPLGVVLRDEALERAYRAALRVRSEELVRYLASQPVLDDMLAALVSEERNMAEASEALAIILNNLEPVTEALVASHLPRLFSYLDTETLQPRRAYFFLRAVSFLFQNRTKEMFAYVGAHGEVVASLIRHVRVQHVAQLILNMLAVERQQQDTSLAWSERAGLVTRLADLLREAPETHLDALHKFLQDLCAQYSLDSTLARSLLSADNGVLLRSLHNLLQVPRQADSVVKILDSVVLPILTKNSEDAEFVGAALAHLRAAAPQYAALLTQRSMSGALAGAKLVQALAKHGQLVALLGDSDEVMAAFLSLLFTHKWANVLHEVVTATLLHALQQGDAATLVRVLRAGLIARTITVLKGTEASGNRGHLLLLANALKDCLLPEVQQALDADPDWASWQPALTELNSRNISFRQLGDQDAHQVAAATATIPTLTVTMTSGDLAAKRFAPTVTPASSPDIVAKMPAPLSSSDDASSSAPNISASSAPLSSESAPSEPQKDVSSAEEPVEKKEEPAKMEVEPVEKEEEPIKKEEEPVRMEEAPVKEEAPSQPAPAAEISSPENPLPEAKAAEIGASPSAAADSAGDAATQ